MHSKPVQSQLKGSDSYSTYFLTSVLPKHGQIDTLELSPLHARLANELFLDADLYPFPKVYVGPALDLLRDPNGAFAKPLGSTEGVPPDKRGYDLVFIDADKERACDYFLEALRLTRKGGLIIVDNAIRGGRWVVSGSWFATDAWLESREIVMMTSMCLG